jgi:protein gp37
MAQQGEHGIAWTDCTWNPIRGCTRVSSGCVNCYAERTAMRFSGKNGPYEGLVKTANGHPQWTGEVRFVEKHLADPLTWRQPRRIFVNSMSDLFHEGVSDEWVGRIFEVMDKCERHTFQVLTKRPGRMLDWFKREWTIHGALAKPLPNVWLGVSCENQKTADERIPPLLQTPAAVRWVSFEPLLSAIKLTRQHAYCPEHDFASGFCTGPCQHLRMLNWAVVGGESGPGARPMHPQWARSIRDQCQAVGLPFFFKQWGEWAPIYEDAPDEPGIHELFDSNGIPRMLRVGKKAAGHLLDGVEWSEYPK